MSIEVKLEQLNFNGPLDLLLSLIKKEKIDIYDIPIAYITQQYLVYIEKMEKSNIYVASEFMVMAAQLIYIKSRMLLPRRADIEQLPEGLIDGAEEDPRLPLVRQLEEYERIRTMVEKLEQGTVMSRDFFMRGYTELRIDAIEDEYNPYDLVKAFYRLIEAKKDDEDFYTVALENVSVMDTMNEIMDTIRESGRISFVQHAARFRTRIEVIVFFLAILELAKLTLIRLRQNRLFDDIEIDLRLEDYENGPGQDVPAGS